MMIEPLTPRELDVIRLLAEGKSDKSLAVALGISPLTVRNHLRNAREKTGLNNRTQLALYAIQAGLAPLPGIRGPLLCQ